MFRPLVDLKNASLTHNNSESAHSLNLHSFSISISPTHLSSVRIVCISDTHGNHKYIHRASIPEGDLIVHTGDICKTGSKNQMIDFADWFGALPHRNKFLVGGNHDSCLEGNNPDICSEKARDQILSNAGIILLHDKLAVISGINIYGTPWQLPYKQMAFNLDDSARENRYKEIPNGTHVLLTHNPPYGVLDQESTDGPHLGCSILRKRVEELSELQLCVFGHIHLGRGHREIGKTHFINASMVGGPGYSQNPYSISQEPFVVDIAI